MQICDHQVAPPADLIRNQDRSGRLYKQQRVPFRDVLETILFQSILLQLDHYLQNGVGRRRVSRAGTPPRLA